MKSYLNYSLIFIGLFQIVGLIPQLSPLKNFGATWLTSPLPMIFQRNNGYEEYTSKFSLKFYNNNTPIIETSLTPALFQKIPGPQMRRNTYGRLLSKGPTISEHEQNKIEDVLKENYCTQKKILDFLSLPSGFNNFDLQVIHSKKDARTSVTYGVFCI